MSDELSSEAIQYRWHRREPIRGVSYLLGDRVVVARGPHAGAAGVAVALAALDPEPHYRVALGAGAGEDEFAQSELTSPVPVDMAAMMAGLQAWYAAQCDGDWEHDAGPTLTALDNPGWLLRIPLAGTNLDGTPFPPIVETAAERDWIHCTVRDGSWHGAGGPHRLGDIVAIFIRWAQAQGAA